VIVGYFLNALFGATPLHCASLQGNLGAVELLLSAGAHIDSQHQSLGRTPLMLAAIYGHRSICELLVQKGASLTVRDTRTGKTAAQWAALKGRRDLSLRLAPPTVFASPLGKGAKKYQVAPAAPPAKE
jgi:ankyrin repeat protein